MKEFETAVVIEPSVFELSKFYCILFSMRFTSSSDVQQTSSFLTFYSLPNHSISCWWRECTEVGFLYEYKTKKTSNAFNCQVKQQIIKYLFYSNLDHE